MNFVSPSSLAPRRGSVSNQVSHLSSPHQGRYKGLISTVGITKFSAWKRECDIPKIYFHDFILNKVDEKPRDRLWMKDVAKSRAEHFGRIRKLVSNIASGLTKIGFGIGDRICMYCPNYVDYWLICFAAWSCGGCIMPVNHEMDPEDLVLQLREAPAKILVCDEWNLDDSVQLGEEHQEIEHIVVIGCADKKKAEHSSIVPMGDLLDDDGERPPAKNLNMKWEEDVIYMPFTSDGTMGIMHTHKSLLSSFYSPENSANHLLDQSLGESVACGNWFFHMTGFYVSILSAIYGLSVYTLSEYSDNMFLDMIADNKIATVAVYPWQVRMLSQSPNVSQYDLNCLKILVTGGDILSNTIRMEVMEKIASIKYVREAYGLNQCGIVCLTYPKEKKNSLAGGLTTSKSVDIRDDHAMCLGLPNMYSQIKIVNRQTGLPVSGPEEQGEICVKSPQCFIGYFNKIEINKKVFDSDGFFHTGDLGYYDSNGSVYFIERIANLIQFWMYELAPSILESRFLCSPNILDAAVVGIPNKENGQVPRAYVVLRPGLEETEENLINMVESRLQDHERIRGGLYFVQNIPRDNNWKVRRDILEVYQPKSTADVVWDPEDEDISNEDGNSFAPNAITIKKSPKLANKFVKELSKQANGCFIATAVQNTPSARTIRANRVKEKDSANGCGKEAELATLSDAKLSNNSCSTGGLDETFSYWYLATWSSKVLEHILMEHPAVDDVVVKAVHIDGIGDLPRGYVVIKVGYEVTAEELVHFVSDKVLVDTDRLRGGIVFVDKLPKDASGKLFISVDKFDADVESMDNNFVQNQPKVKLLT